MRGLRTKIRIKRFMAVMLSVVLMLSSSLSALAVTAKDSNYVISNLDKARTALEKLVASKAIKAAVYLKDSYVIKSEADYYSDEVIAIASGQTVSILSVDADSGRNIWFKVQYSYSGGKVTGYIEREFLACSDERFLNWEDKYVTTLKREEINSMTDCSDIMQFPESYRDALYELKTKHPNWTFVRQNINLDWNTVIEEEHKGERSLISGSADSSFKEEPSANTAGWYIATRGIIKYYMDPRNFIAEDNIFMFELQSYNETAHSVQVIQKVLDGTFMSGKVPDASITYAQTFVNIGSSLNASPLALAARVKQEQGKGTSPLISGTYPGFEGYYNYFNVKANGSTNEQIYKNGLTYAKEQGWNTRTKSLKGGSQLMAKNYIQRGQDTLYLQKYDVDNSDGTLYTHQYMQNIAAPYSESLSVYKGYNTGGLLDNSFVFKIPVYDNMPSGKCIKPNAQDVVSLDVTSINNLPVEQNAVITPLINGGQATDTAFVFSSSDKTIATVDSNGVITGKAPGTATISVKRKENATNTAKCTVKVVKVDIPDLNIDMPKITVVYSPTQTLADIELPEGFTWANPKLVPQVENSGYNAKYNPDPDVFVTVTVTIPVIVEKAETDMTGVKIPENLTIDVGAELSTVVLPKGFAWVDSTQTAPYEIGAVEYEATYCTDASNYNPASITLKVEVVCRTHEFGEWQGTPADCINDGEMSRTCGICGYIETVEQKATGHCYESAVVEEPNDLEEGLRVFTCKNCYDTYSETIPVISGPHRHKYRAEVIKEAECLVSGKVRFYCACGYEFNESSMPLGHWYDDDNICVRCQYELKVVPVHIHDFTYAECTSTCTEAGDDVYLCGCGETYREEADELGHIMENGICERCGYSTLAIDEDEVPTDRDDEIIESDSDNEDEVTVEPIEDDEEIIEDVVDDDGDEIIESDSDNDEDDEIAESSEDEADDEVIESAEDDEIDNIDDEVADYIGVEIADEVGAEPTPEVKVEVTPTPTPEAKVEVTPTPIPEVDVEVTPASTPEIVSEVEPELTQEPKSEAVANDVAEPTPETAVESAYVTAQNNDKSVETSEDTFTMKDEDEYGIISAESDDVTPFATKILFYVVITAVLMIAGATTGLVLCSVNRRKEDPFYSDEEDK